jgi:aminomethyltransferase
MKKTPLNQAHIDAGARMVDFGGWHMPVQYSGLSLEHQAVRGRAGLFDVSHMGEVLAEGADAEAYLNRLVTNNVSRLQVGQAQYTVMCYPNGGIVDDLLVYKRGEGRYLLCINAGNIAKDWEWIQSQAQGFKNLQLREASDEFCQIALQGPLAERILAPLVKAPLAPVKYYHFIETQLLGDEAIVSRTGYTGEDGFEIYAPAGQAVAIWNALLEAGRPLGLLPCGLGARDTLRLEMKFPLYGQEISAETNPLEAGLGWVVKLDKVEDFSGKTALQEIKAKGVSRHLVGLKVLERGIPRQGYEVFDPEGKEKVGQVTSGTLSPSLGVPIAIAYVRHGLHQKGSRLAIRVRDRFFPAEVVPTPFYRRPETI